MRPAIFALARRARQLHHARRFVRSQFIQKHLDRRDIGEVSVSEESSRGVAEDSSTPSAEVEALTAEVKRQGEELVRLQTLVEHMAAELGISLDKFAREP